MNWNDVKPYQSQLSTRRNQYSDVFIDVIEMQSKMASTIRNNAPHRHKETAQNGWLIHISDWVSQGYLDTREIWLQSHNRLISVAFMTLLAASQMVAVIRSARARFSAILGDLPVVSEYRYSSCAKDRCVPGYFQYRNESCIARMAWQTIANHTILIRWLLQAYSSYYTWLLSFIILKPE